MAEFMISYGYVHSCTSQFYFLLAYDLADLHFVFLHYVCKYVCVLFSSARFFTKAHTLIALCT